MIGRILCRLGFHQWFMFEHPTEPAVFCLRCRVTQ